MPSLFDVTPGHFKNNPNFGRTTNVKELSTGREMSFLGALSVTEAIQQFENQAPEFFRR